jgi:glyoxylase-like metal-dependent hydrolase (beta-lactamase superfamily II)/rhodanese-related sulfurtransferase
MILEQFYLSCLAQASYIVGDEVSGVAAVIDPRRDVSVYLEAAAERGLDVRDVLLTHFHADFLAGHLELRELCGATIHLGERAEAEYAFEPLGDGDELVLGPNVTLRVLETPGHTPESVCYLVIDTSGEKPRTHAVLTGDTLFIGDVGRPDLLASVGVTAGELAEMLYDSLREKLLPLDDAVLVYPGHGAGSSCGRSLSTDTVSTIGDQRRLNYALQDMDVAAFTALVTTDQPQAPPYFSHDAELNKRERPTLEQTLARALQGLGLGDALRHVNAGAQLLDSRDAAAFAAAHLEDSINVGLSGKFASWAGTLLELGRPIVIVAEPGREEETAVRLGRIGFDQILGYLEGGMEALAPRPDLVSRLERIGPAEAREELSSDSPPLLLDVRSEVEREGGAIPGSVCLPLPELRERLEELPKDRRIVVACASGYRSSAAASILLRNGFDRVADLIGGQQAWEATG